MNAPTATAAPSRTVAESIARVRGHFEAKPDIAKGEDPPATATLGDRLAVEITGPEGQRARSDMPASIGGKEAAPTPGWYLRAGMAACTATVVAMYAAEQGIVLESLEVTVSSHSDKRGLLGMADVSPASRGLHTMIRLAASGVPEAVLRELAERAHRHSPVAATIAAGESGTLGIEIAG
jgi:uncharacterized OsmC-like protein